jgi:hypothetical protein
MKSLRILAAALLLSSAAGVALADSQIPPPRAPSSSYPKTSLGYFGNNGPQDQAPDIIVHNIGGPLTASQRVKEAQYEAAALARQAETAK